MDAPQILAHLIGDYVFQNQWMATRKTTQWLPALVHAVFYTLAFLILFGPSWALLIIGGTHAVIDRYRLAKYVCRFWGIGENGWVMEKLGVKIDSPPPFLAVWLLIIVDNTSHLLINGLALGFLG